MPVLNIKYKTIRLKIKHRKQRKPSLAIDINNFAPKLATNQCYYTQYEEVPKQ